MWEKPTSRGSFISIARINSFGFKEKTKINRCDIPKNLEKQGWKKVKN